LGQEEETKIFSKKLRVLLKNEGSSDRMCNEKGRKKKRGPDTMNAGRDTILVERIVSSEQQGGGG